MALIIPLFPIGAPTTVVIDGIEYRPPVIDADGHLQVDVISNVFPSAPDTLDSAVATVTTAGTRVQLATITCRSISVKAHPGNAGLIYLGPADVAAANGYQLNPGESVDLAISNANKLYVDAATSGDGVSYLTVN